MKTTTVLGIAAAIGAAALVLGSAVAAPSYGGVTYSIARGSDGYWYAGIAFPHGTQTIGPFASQADADSGAHVAIDTYRLTVGR